jgi:cysteine-rich repeat protein
MAAFSVPPIIRICGNGIRTSDEECDDFGLVDGDGCDSSCRIELGYMCRNPIGDMSSCEEVPLDPSSTFIVFEWTSLSVTEAVGSATLSALRYGDLSEYSSVNLQTYDGSARSTPAPYIPLDDKHPVDYNLLAKTLHFEPRPPTCTPPACADPAACTGTETALIDAAIALTSEPKCTSAVCAIPDECTLLEAATNDGITALTAAAACVAPACAVAATCTGANDGNGVACELSDAADGCKVVGDDCVFNEGCTAVESAVIAAAASWTESQHITACFDFGAVYTPALVPSEAECVLKGGTFAAGRLPTEEDCSTATNAGGTFASLQQQTIAFNVTVNKDGVWDEDSEDFLVLMESGINAIFSNSRKRAIVQLQDSDVPACVAKPCQQNAIWYASKISNFC